MNICLECGSGYEYDHRKALGASSDRCAPCRKRQSRLNKHIECLLVAGNKVMQCRKCGYSKHPGALVLVDGVSLLNAHKLKPVDLAKTQFILCANCDAERKHGEFRFRVLSNAYPIDVQFFTSRIVTVVKEEVFATVVNYSKDAIEAEVVPDDYEVHAQAHLRAEKKLLQ